MKLTLGKKLGLGFGVILALTVCSTTLNYLKSDDIRQIQDSAIELRFPSLETARKLQRDLNPDAEQGSANHSRGSGAGEKRASEEVVRWSLGRD
jgi:hypothetical protein